MAKAPKAAPKKSGSVDFEEARQRAQIAAEYWDEVYPAMQNDLAFLAGHQWSAEDRADRKNRITITANDLGQYLDQVVGDIRQNPASINISPGDIAAQRAKFISNSEREYDGKDVMAGLIRQVEYRSNAQDHYELAGQHSAEAGIGYLRLYTDYMSSTGFDQDIRVERIKNRFSVYLDPMATEPDHSDQNYAFVGDWMLRKTFDKKYPDKVPSSLPHADQAKYWGRDGYVRVTDYYWREEITYEIAQLDNTQVITDGSYLEGEEKAEAERIWQVAEAGGRIVRRRKVTSYCVKMAKITYDSVLEGPVKLPGTLIPIAPVVGKRIEGDEDTLYYGLFRFAKDPKMMENYWLSAATERMAQMPKMPWLVTEAMIEGYETVWAEANRGNKAYLPYNPGQSGSKPERVTPPVLAQGELEMMMGMREIVKGAVGQHDASIGKATNQQSGKALLALERSADVGNFVFADNLRMAISYIGRVMLEWIPHYYGSARLVTIRHPNGEVDTIEINRPDGQNDLAAGQYEHHVTTGPAYSTLRQQASEQIMRFYEMVPDLAPATLDIALGNMDWPGAELMAKRARKMVPPGLLDKNELTEDEKETAQQPPQPSPEDEVAMAEAEADMAEADADMALADAQKATAEADIVQAEARIAGAGMDLERQAMQPQPGQQPANPQAGGSAPVTQDDLEALKNEIAQMLAQALNKGATQ